MIRVATVANENGKASLSFDYTGEKYYLTNFKSDADMDVNNVRNGDRVFAFMTLRAVGSYVNSTITLDSLTKIPNLPIAINKPSADDMDSFYQMSVMELAGIDLSGKESYPPIWNNGHHVCVAPVFFSPASEPNPVFSIWADSLRSDTLVMTLYANIPGNDYSLRPYYRQTMLNIDLSDLRLNVDNPIEQARRNAIMHELDSIGPTDIYVEISTLDVTYAANSKNQMYPTFINNIKQTRTVKVPFDF